MKLEKQFLKINKKMKQKMARGPSEWPSLRGELSRDFSIPGRYDHEGTMAEHEATALRPHQAAGGVGQRCDCRTRVGQDKSHHEHPKSLEKGLFWHVGEGPFTCQVSRFSTNPPSGIWIGSISIKSIYFNLKKNKHI